MKKLLKLVNPHIFRFYDPTGTRNKYFIPMLSLLPTKLWSLNESKVYLLDIAMDDALIMAAGGL